MESSFNEIINAIKMLDLLVFKAELYIPQMVKDFTVLFPNR